MTPPSHPAPLPDQAARTITIAGLGLMGTAFAARFLEHGWQVRVWNRSPEKARPLLEQGAAWADNPLHASPRVLLCLYDSAAVAAVVQSMASGLHPGQIIIDSTTGEPDRSAALAQTLAASGVTYLEAPVSGSSEQTRRGEATVMVGGDPRAFESCADLWPVMGARVCYCGGSGTAAQMKLVTNLVLGLNRAVLAEGLAYAAALGIDAAAALEVMRGSMAYSRAMDAKGRKMIEGDFSAQARLSQHLKDVRLMLQGAAAAGQPLPLTEAHRQLLEQAEAAGWGDLDNSAVLKAIRAEPLS